MARQLVSILTPSFNQGHWLADNMRSVQSQTYPHIEHIIMDGGSKDGSLNLLRAQAGSNVRWRCEPDEGQSHAINKAFGESRGEIIGWINSDDAYFSRDVVDTVVKLFAARSDVSVVYGHAALVNADGLVLQIIWVPGFNYRLLRLHNYIIQPAAFIRRSALGDRLVDEAYKSAMDRELWLRLGRSQRFQRIGKILAIDRHHPYRKSYTRPDLAREDSNRMVSTYAVPSGKLATAQLKMW